MDAAFFDRRKYPTASAAEGYGEWAATYEATVAAGLDEPLLASLTSIKWSDVNCAADIACGTGRAGAWLAAHRLKAIDGIDLTPEMLAIAEKRGVYRRLAVADVGATGLSSATYGVCTMILADEHLADLKPAYREASRILGPAGSFVLVGYHPYFLMNGLITHFHRADGRAVAIRSYVHQLSDHFAAGRDAGMSLIEFRECVIDEDWLRTKPKWRPYLHWPASFAMVWRKP